MLSHLCPCSWNDLRLLNDLIYVNVQKLFPIRQASHPVPATGPAPPAGTSPGRFPEIPGETAQATLRVQRPRRNPRAPAVPSTPTAPPAFRNSPASAASATPAPPPLPPALAPRSSTSARLSLPAPARVPTRMRPPRGTAPFSFAECCTVCLPAPASCSAPCAPRPRRPESQTPPLPAVAHSPRRKSARDAATP